LKESLKAELIDLTGSSAAKGQTGSWKLLAFPLGAAGSVSLSVARPFLGCVVGTKTFFLGGESPCIKANMAGNKPNLADKE
jgi:hypothetical protein